VARALYGVVLEEGSLDEAATERTRLALRTNRKDGFARQLASPLSASSSSGGRPPQREHPIAEALEVVSDAGSHWIRCARCGFALCSTGQDWAGACARSSADPATMGPGWAILDGEPFEVQQECCPSCGALFSTAVVSHGENGEGLLSGR
jgi:hypothetical protein